VSGLKVFDLVVMVSFFTIAAVLTVPDFDVATIREFMALRISLGNFILFGAFAALWHLLFSVFGLYKDSLFLTAPRKAIDVLKATSIGICSIVALAVPFKISFVDAEFVLIFWTGTSFLSFCIRLIARELLVRHNNEVANLRRVLIVGVNTRSVSLAQQITAKHGYGCHVIGFADDTATHVPNFEEFGYELVSDYKNLSNYLGKTMVDEVLVCLPIRSRSEDISEIVLICEEQGISVGMLRDLFKWTMATSAIRQFGDQTIVMVRPHTINGARAATKRALDVLLSAFFIILLLPVFIVTALLIKLTSPGPVNFSQERVGLNKKRFRMLKFRTMVVGAEQQQAALEHFNEAVGPVFKINGDPRITPIGKFLRQFSIDELPQLFNVLKGDMSLVGPRPLPLRDYAGFSEDWHRRRISVRPGITGLWQINGRDQSSFDEWVKLDLEYIDRWSLSRDFEIMLKTVPAVLRGSGE
jgi:exopolysaccharide biosynthesis polyprenyl glycosylphosphotransferase